MLRPRLFVRKPLLAAGYSLGVLLLICGLGLSAATQPANADSDDHGVVPIALCALHNPDGTFTAVWSYRNSYDHAVKIPVGSKNKVSPQSKNGKQPEQFQPGTNQDVFRTDFTEDEVVRWTLIDANGTRRTASTSDSTRRCADLTETPDPDTPSPSASDSQSAPSTTVTITAPANATETITPGSPTSDDATATSTQTSTPTSTQTIKTALTPTPAPAAATPAATLTPTMATPTATSTSSTGSGLTATPSPLPTGITPTPTTPTATTSLSPVPTSSAPTATLSGYPAPTGGAPTATLAGYPAPTSITGTPPVLPVSGGDLAGTAAARELTSRLMVDAGLILLGLIGILHGISAVNSLSRRK